PAPGPERLGSHRMGTVRKQSASALLQADRRRPQTVSPRVGRLRDCAGRDPAGTSARIETGPGIINSRRLGEEVKCSTRFVKYIAARSITSTEPTSPIKCTGSSGVECL